MSCSACFRGANLQPMSYFSCCRRANLQIMSCFSCFRRENLLLILCFSSCRRATLQLVSCFSCCKRANRQIMSCFSCFRGANLKNKHIFVNLPVLFYCWQINQRVPNGITERHPVCDGVNCGAVSVTIGVTPGHQNQNWAPTDVEACHHTEDGFDCLFLRCKVFHRRHSRCARQSSQFLGSFVNNM